MSANLRTLPSIESCEDCGATIAMSLTAENSFTYSYCVNVGQIAENFTVDYDWNYAGAGETFQVSVLYDGVTTSTGAVAAAGSLTVVKTDSKPTTAIVTLTSTVEAVVFATVNCPIGTELTIVQVCITSQSESNLSLIHI